MAVAVVYLLPWVPDRKNCVYTAERPDCWYQTMATRNWLVCSLEPAAESLITLISTYEL